MQEDAAHKGAVKKIERSLACPEFVEGPAATQPPEQRKKSAKAGQRRTAPTDVTGFTPVTATEPVQAGRAPGRRGAM